jgi:hypothetical protein
MEASTLKLTWEKVGSERTAFYKSRTEMQVHQVTPGQLQVLAMAKMTGITMISAHFSGDPVFFYPCACLMFESQERVEFIGTYKADLSDYTEPASSEFDIKKSNELPSFCVRRAFWRKRQNSEAVSEFRAATNKKDYVLSNLQVEINVSFIRLESFSILANLISDSVKLVKNGINFKDCHEMRNPYHNIQLAFSDECMDFDFLYKPNCVVSSSLDNLTGRWQKHLIESPLEESIVPDEDFRVSYQRSLFDCLKDFDLLDGAGG